MAVRVVHAFAMIGKRGTRTAIEGYCCLQVAAWIQRHANSGEGSFPGTVEQRGKRLFQLAGKGSPQRAEGDGDTPESVEAGGQIPGPRPREGESRNGDGAP
mgnify:CR=1 FL=1